MSRQPESLQRVTYVDFLNAIVIGSAIQLMAPLSVSFKFFALLFLSFVMLEDFWIYHTQIAKHDARDQESFSILLIQWAIPLTWYLAVIAVPDSPRAGLFSFGLFYFFKWLGGFTHYRHAQQISHPLCHRIWTFLVPMVTCFFSLFAFTRSGLLIQVFGGQYFVRLYSRFQFTGGLHALFVMLIPQPNPYVECQVWRANVM